MKISTFTFVIISLTFSTFLTAQTDQTMTDSSVLLQNILIKEARLQLPFKDVSRSLQVINRTQIESAAAQSVAELLTMVSGLDVRQRGVRGAQADVSIRGGTFDQTLVLLNGIPLSDPQTGHHALNLPVDMRSIERIEILKGAGARICGQNAFAGVINIVTQVPKTGQTSAGIYFGDKATNGYHVGFSLPTGKFNQSFQYAHDASDGYRDSPKPDTRGNSDYKIDNFFYQNQLDAPIGTLKMMAGHTERAFGGSGFYAATNVSDEYEQINTSFAAAQLETKTATAWRITPRVWWRRNADDYVFYRYNPSLFRNYTVSNVIGAEVPLSYQSKYGTTGFGVNATQTYFESSRLDTHRRTQIALNLEHRFSFLSGRLDVTPGLLWSNYSDFGSDVFPGIEAGYRVGSDWKVFGSWSRTFRIPTFTDLYFQNAANNNNPNLKAERADNYELGTKYNHDAWHGEFTIFRRNGQNIIDRNKQFATDKWTPTNLTNVRLTGIELSATYTNAFDNTAFLKRANIGATYIFAADTSRSAENITTLSRYALDNLRWQITANVEHRLFARLFQTIQFRYLERVNLSDSYNITDVRWTWRGKTVQAWGQVSNVFDAAYSESNGIPMPKRWGALGLNIVLGY